MDRPVRADRVRDRQEVVGQLLQGEAAAQRLGRTGPAAAAYVVQHHVEAVGQAAGHLGPHLLAVRIAVHQHHRGVRASPARRRTARPRPYGPALPRASRPVCPAPARSRGPLLLPAPHVRQIVVQPESALLRVRGVRHDEDLLELRSRAAETEVRFDRPQARLRRVVGELVRAPQGDQPSRWPCSASEARPFNDCVPNPKSVGDQRRGRTRSTLWAMTPKG